MLSTNERARSLEFLQLFQKYIMDLILFIGENASSLFRKKTSRHHIVFLFLQYHQTWNGESFVEYSLQVLFKQLRRDESGGVKLKKQKGLGWIVLSSQRHPAWAFLVFALPLLLRRSLFRSVLCHKSMSDVSVDDWWYLTHVKKIIIIFYTCAVGTFS